MQDRRTAHELIAARGADHLALLRSFIAQPSFSEGDAGGVALAAGFLVERLQRLGCQVAELAPTPGLPAVWARYDAGAARTLAVYGYFDTNVVGTGWSVEPYGAVVAPRPPYARVLYGRGAAPKGSALAFLNALEAIRDANGGLPVNLLFLYEGEEFLGSPHVPLLIERYRADLERADAILWPGPSQAANGDVTLFLGNKGLLKVKIECSGDRWGRGPIGGAAHSSTQGVLDHPAWRLIHALATLYDPHTGQILVEGFTDGLRGPTQADEALLDVLAETYRGREASAVPGIAPRASVRHFLNDMMGRDVFRSYCFAPTMNIDGLRAGQSAPDMPAWTLPNVAACTIDHRLPPGLDPETCLAKIRRHLDRRGYSDIDISTLATVAAQRTNIDDDLVQAALKAFAKRGIRPAIWPIRGTSGPAGHFSDAFGRGVVGSTGVGYASGHSGPDEFLVVEGDGRVGGLVELEQSFADLILAYSGTSKA